jgi:hypothetical protein
LKPQPFCCESFAITTRLNFIVDIPIIIISYHIISSQISDINDLTQFLNFILYRSKIRVYIKMKMSILHPKHESVFLKAKKNCCFVFFVSLCRFVRLFHTQKVF